METIGVVGLGRMGGAIARRMADQGHSVLGWTRSGRAVDGISNATDLPALVTTSDTLILSLLNDHAVGEVLDALLDCDLTGKQIIETSTVVPAVLQDRLQRITDKGASTVDAPISGGPELVTAGKCGIFIGGSDEAANRARRSLVSISERIFHVGPLGAGLAMKTINNSMLQTYFNGLMEMMPVAKAAGLPLETVMKIVCGGPAGLPMVTDRLPKILGDDDDVGFEIQTALKDADVFRRVVQSYGLDSEMLVQFAAHAGDAVEAGLGHKDPAVMVRRAYDPSSV